MRSSSKDETTPTGGADTPGLAPPWKADSEATGEALGRSQAQFEVLTDAMPQMVWSTLPDGFHDYYNARWYEFTGVPPGSTDGEGWNGMFHPDDQELAWARWRHSLATGEPYEIEYRLRHHSGEYRWTLGRALPVRDADGAITRWIGTCTDIDEAKRAAEQNEVLSRELSHRIKNIFAVVSGLVGLTARHDPVIKPYARQLQERIGALGRAHEFARPHSEQSQPSIGDSTVQGLLAALFAPYPAYDAGRVTMSGDDAPLDDRGATPIALTFHELATNAAKYGALSTETGEVTVHVARRGDSLLITWRERGGPAVAGQPDHMGFGTRLADMSVIQQLGGKLTRRWEPAGLEVEVEVLTERLSRG